MTSPCVEAVPHLALAVAFVSSTCTEQLVR
jgi:hypothetical protein